VSSKRGSHNFVVVPVFAGTTYLVALNPQRVPHNFPVVGVGASRPRPRRSVQRTNRSLGVSIKRVRINRAAAADGHANFKCSSADLARSVVKIAHNQFRAGRICEHKHTKSNPVNLRI
jgi:hypothetical protein